MRAFCAELKRRGISITWSAFARVNTVDAETLAVMRDAGYIKTQAGPSTTRWYWTCNNRSDAEY